MNAKTFSSDVSVSTESLKSSVSLLTVLRNVPVRSQEVNNLNADDAAAYLTIRKAFDQEYRRKVHLDSPALA